MYLSDEIILTQGPLTNFVWALSLHQVSLLVEHQSHNNKWTYVTLSQFLFTGEDVVESSKNASGQTLS